MQNFNSPSFRENGTFYECIFLDNCSFIKTVWIQRLWIPFTRWKNHCFKIIALAGHFVLDEISSQQILIATHFSETISLSENAVLFTLFTMWDCPSFPHPIHPHTHSHTNVQKRWNMIWELIELSNYETKLSHISLFPLMLQVRNVRIQRTPTPPVYTHISIAL